MPLFFIPMVGLMGIGIAMLRRYAKAPASGPSDDLAAGLLRWAVGLLSAHRAEWGQAMLGELDHIEGRSRRLRFALGCAGAALVLPPWGPAAAGVWAMIALAVGSVGGYAAVAVHYRLAGGDWVAAAILAVFVTGFLLGAAALVRRPGVAVPGLVGGLLVALTWRTLSGFTFYEQIAPDIVPWHHWIQAVLLPFALGAAGTLWSRDPIVGKRIARLAAISAGLGLFLYATIAVAVIGAGGPPTDELPTAQAIVSDRLGTNMVMLLFTTMVVATVGWAGAAATAALAPGRLRPVGAAGSVPVPGATPVVSGGPATVEDGRPAVRARSWRRRVRLLLLCLGVVVALLLAVSGWLRG